MYVPRRQSQAKDSPRLVLLGAAYQCLHFRFYEIIRNTINTGKNKMRGDCGCQLGAGPRRGTKWGRGHTQKPRKTQKCALLSLSRLLLLPNKYSNNNTGNKKPTSFAKSLALRPNSLSTHRRLLASQTTTVGATTDLANTRCAEG